jgi:hypothetical protein
VPTNEDIEAAIAVLRYSADEDSVREKMKTAFPHCQAMVNNADKSADVFSVFPRVYQDWYDMLNHYTTKIPNTASSVNQKIMLCLFHCR